MVLEPRKLARVLPLELLPLYSSASWHIDRLKVSPVTWLFVARPVYCVGRKLCWCFNLGAHLWLLR